MEYLNEKKKKNEKSSWSMEVWWEIDVLVLIIKKNFQSIFYFNIFLA